MLMMIGGILLAVASIFALIVLINAFKESVGQGLLCMFVPLYIFYFGFAKYQSPKKGLVLGGWLGGQVLGIALVVIGTVVAANDAVAAFNAELGQLPDMAQEPGAAAGDGRVVSCNLAEQPARTCNQYSLGSSYTQDNASQHCEMIQVISDDKVALGDGPCPTENALAKCEPRFGSQTSFYYRDPTPGVDNDAAMNAMESLCVGTFTRL